MSCDKCSELLRVLYRLLEILEGMGYPVSKVEEAKELIRETIGQ
jgi:hypothetical protein